MQNRYTCDIGDFGKYALLNYIQEKNPKLSLGVVWYLVNPEHTDGKHQANDGKHIPYLGLDKPHKVGKKFQLCEPLLFSQLQTLVAENNRSVQAISENRILGRCSSFFEEVLSCGENTAPDKRLEHRSEWLSKALSAVQHSDIVFLDPDNGLAIDPSEEKLHPSLPERDGSGKDDAKYVLLSELKKFWDDGKRVVVLYHHPNRKEKGVDHNSQIQSVADLIGKQLNSIVLPMRYRRGTSRVYFIIVPSKIVCDWKTWLRKFESEKPWPVSKSAGKAFECKFEN